MDSNNISASIKTPEAESEAPTTRIQPIKPLVNGVLKRHHLHLSPAAVVTYKECLKNHAATMGGHAVDGCGEFMPSPSTDHSNPTSLKCAACGCHRNFHRRDPDESSPPSTAVIEYQPHHRHHPPPPPPPNPIHLPRSPKSNSASPPPISSSYMLLALSGGGGAGHVSSCPAPPQQVSPPGSGSGGRKRFRTKFTAGQKERMLQFAERVGWKMQRKDEEVIAAFCREIGVDKGVFKVWMHNNKSTFGKNKLNTNGNNNNNSGFEISTTPVSSNYHPGSGQGNNNNNGAGHHEHDGSAVQVANGSSSSS